MTTTHGIEPAPAGIGGAGVYVHHVMHIHIYIAIGFIRKCIYSFKTFVVSERPWCIYVCLSEATCLHASHVNSVGSRNPAHTNPVEVERCLQRLWRATRLMLPRHTAWHQPFMMYV